MSDGEIKRALSPSRSKLESLAQETDTLTRLFKTGRALLGLQAGTVTRTEGSGYNELQRTIALPFEPGTSIFIRAGGLGRRSFIRDPYHIVCGTIDNSGGGGSIVLELGHMEYANPAEPFDTDIASRFDKFVQFVLEQKNQSKA